METVDVLRRQQSWTQYLTEAGEDDEDSLFGGDDEGGDEEDDKGEEDAPAEEPAAPPQKKPEEAVAESKASIDGQVNKFLTQALEEAGSAKTEGLDYRMMTRRLLEANDEEGSSGAAKKTLEEIDLGSLAESVVRLIENFDSLIEVRDTLIEMAKVQIEKTYDKTVVTALIQLLEEEYDIASGESQWDREIENQPPAAKGAGPTGQ